MVQLQTHDKTFRHSNEDFIAFATNHRRTDWLMRADSAQTRSRADGTWRVPATLFHNQCLLTSLAILLFCFHSIAIGQEYKRKTILLKDAGVIQKAGDGEKKNENRPRIKIQRVLDNEKAAPEFLKPLINVELSFVKRVCEPTDDQMAAIVVAAKDAHKVMANTIMEQRPGVDLFGRNQEMFMGPNQERMSVNPLERVREDVAKLLKPIVSEQQYSRYVAEAKSRDEYERDAAVGTVLEMLDAKLILSPDQQTQLQEKLSADETLPDLHTLSVYSSNTQYMPQLSERLITPVLTEAQKQIWSSLNRISFHQSILQGNSEGFTEDWLK